MATLDTQFSGLVLGLSVLAGTTVGVYVEDRDGVDTFDCKFESNMEFTTGKGMEVFVDRILNRAVVHMNSAYLRDAGYVGGRVIRYFIPLGRTAR